VAAPASPKASSSLFGECRVGLWSGNRNLDDQRRIGKATCLGQAKWRASSGLGAAASLHLGSRDREDARKANADLREAHLDWQSERWSLRAGRQLLAWGRADRVNPTDHFSARDFTLLVPEDEEQRLGSDAVQLKHFFNPGWSLAGVVARFRANGLPQGLLPPNTVAAERPRRAMGALKLERTGSGADGSLSYFDGWGLSPIYTVQPAPSQPAPAFVFQAEHQRVRALGGDLALALGRWNLRGEAAAYRLGDDRSASNPRRASRFVLGVDTDIGSTANLNLQVFTIRRSDYTEPDRLADPGQQALARGLDRLNSEFGRQETGLTLRVADRWLNDRLKVELGAIFDLSNRSRLLRPRLAYNLSDQWRWTVGADWFDGPEQSFFGSRKANRLAFTEASFVF
jgi:hypothetical protein